MPKVLLTGKAVKIDDVKYFARTKDSFITEMANQGFTFTEQMGAGYLFEKDDVKYFSESRMYSSHFMVFTHPYAN